MEIKYIFIGKKGYNIKKNEEHMIFFNELTNEITKEYFVLKDSEYKIEYRAMYEYIDKNAFSLNIELKGRNTQNGKRLSEVNKKITRGSHRSNYHIVNIYDEVSEYYCEKGYKVVSNWERKLRELIYRIVIKEHGEMWYEEIITKELEDTMKKRGNNKGIENALQELDISQLENLLFTPYVKEDLLEVLSKDLSINQLKNKNKNDIVKILNKCRPKSVWERFFNDVNIRDIDIRIEKIRKERNKIAHSKEFWEDDYSKFNKDIKFMIKEINKSIEDLNSDKIKIDGIDGLVEAAQAIASMITYSQEQLRKIAAVQAGIMNFQKKGREDKLKCILNGAILKEESLD